MFSCSEEREPKLDWGASFPTSDDSIIRCGEPSGGLVLPHSAEGLGSPREGRAPVPRAQPAARGGQDEAGHGVVDPPLDQSPAPDGLTEVALPPGDLDLSGESPLRGITQELERCLRSAGTDDTASVSYHHFSLAPARAQELEERLRALISEFDDRTPAAGGARTFAVLGALAPMPEAQAG